MNPALQACDRAASLLDRAGSWAALVPIRLLMAYEFAKAGLGKLGASDRLWGDVPGWFAGTRGDFPFPFNVLPNELNWFLVTWVEILGGFALVLGLFTRFWAASLVIVTIVAIFGVHWPEDWNSLAGLWDGYRVTSEDGSGNYRIPLLFLSMLLPLVFLGAGKLSLDHVLRKRLLR